MISKRPFTLIEVMIVSSVLAVALLTSLLFVSNQQLFANIGREKKFGYEKAMQIMNELKTFQEVSSTSGELIYLDDLGDGGSTNAMLSAQVDITDPTHPISSNILTGTDPNDPTHWKYARRIHIIKSSEDSNSKDVRKVGVQIFLTSKDNADEILLAEVWSILQTAADPGFPPTQVYDLYAIAIENVPGWWVYMNNLIPQVENAIKDLEARNPGLDFRVHWITKMGYGRNPFYMPVFNTSADSATATFNSPYFYPSLMPAGSATDEYYVSRLINGHYRDETGSAQNGYDASDNPAPYTIADAYNQANSYPLMLAHYNLRVANNPNEEMPYTLLLDDMHMNPLKYKNALFINLHGELLPVPAMRNYADAAKHPRLDSIVNGDLDRLVAATSHSVTRAAIDASASEITVTQLQNLADDADFAVGDYIRLDNEICQISAIDSDTKTLKIERGKFGTLAASHKVLCPVIHQAVVTSTATSGSSVLAVTSTKGLVPGEKLSAIEAGLTTLGTIDSVSATQVTLTAPLASNCIANTALICSSAVPSLSVTVNNISTALSYHNGGGTSPIGDGDLLNIGGEILQTSGAATNRGLHGSSASSHQQSETVGHINFIEGVRVVAHPENARYHLNDDPAFRVYAWLSDSAPDSTQPERLANLPITMVVKLKNISVSDATIDDWFDLRSKIIDSLTAMGIARIEGGVAPAASRYDNNVTALSYPISPSNDALSATDDEMYARIDPVFIRTSADAVTPAQGHLSIAIRLYNTPLSTPYLSNRGLDSGAKLYGLNYLPTPFGGDFNDDLTSTGTGRKNTARWIVPFPALNTILGYLPVDIASSEIERIFAPLTVETRIGDINLQAINYSGTVVNEIVPGELYGQFSHSEHFKSPQSWPHRTENFSQSHTWSHDLYDGASLIALADDESVPFSDKYQLMGDPRYQPCADVLNAQHHNLFFTNSDIDPTEGMGTTYRGWGGDDVEHDVPRMMQMVREAVMGSNAIFTTINGYSFYYMGLGNEIGYDSTNGFGSSIPVNGTPYNQSGSGWAQHIISGSRGTPAMGGYGFNLIGETSGWVSASALGELYRDADMSSWQNGDALTNYYRIDKANDPTIPAAKRFYSGRRTSTSGSQTFYNVNNPDGTTFDHEFSTSNATILPTVNSSEDVKSDFESTFNMVMPTSITSNRPWRINDSSTNVAEWNSPAYLARRTNTAVLQTFYEHDSTYATSAGEPVRGIASGILQCYDPNNNDKLGYFAIHGISETAEIGSVFIGRYAIMSLLYAHLRASSTDNSRSPTTPLPLLEITAPTDMTDLENPGVISVQWNLQWKRWDEENYTQIGNYNQNLSPTDDGFFKVGYSDDNRESWKYLNSNIAFTEGKAQDIGLEVPADITVPAGLPSEGFFLSAEPEDPAPKTRWNYSMTWDLSGFGKGTYYLRIEYHRKDPATGTYIPSHYSQHMMAITIED